MDYRSILLISAVAFGGSLAALTACTAPDPGAITFAERPSSSGGEPPIGTGGTDGGGDTGAGGANTVFGTTPLAYVNPGVAANNADVTHAGTVEGKDCQTTGCHLDGPKVWVYGGTLYGAQGGGATVAKGEIKIIGPNGAEIGSAYTDANGNFWLEKVGTTIPAGSKVGVRKEGGGAPRMMDAPLQPGDSGCSKAGTCHGGTQGKVYAD